MRLIDADSMKADLLTVDPRYEGMIQWCITVLDAQPTIERKTGEWIPCSERLPEKTDLYLITYIEEFSDGSGKFPAIEIVQYSTHEGTWDADGYEYTDVVAWRPLIEPYKEVK